RTASCRFPPAFSAPTATIRGSPSSTASPGCWPTRMTATSWSTKTAAPGSSTSWPRRCPPAWSTDSPCSATGSSACASIRLRPCSPRCGTRNCDRSAERPALLPRLLRVEGLDQIVGLHRGLGPQVAPDQFAILEKVGLADGDGVAAGPARRHAEGADDFLVRVAHEGERKMLFFLETFLLARRVGAHADDGDAALTQLVVGIAQRAALGGAAGREGAREKVNEGIAFAEGGEVERLAGFSGAGDRGQVRAKVDRFSLGGGKSGKNKGKGKQEAQFHGKAQIRTGLLFASGARKAPGKEPRRNFFERRPASGIFVI